MVIYKNNIIKFNIKVLFNGRTMSNSELVSKLMRYIKSIQDGEKLLSERLLCDKFNCSRNTLREALLFLKMQNLIISKQGKGYYKIKDEYKMELGIKYKNQITRKLNKYNFLKIKNFPNFENENCLYITRNKYFENKIIEYQTMFIQKSLFKAIPKSVYEDSIIDILSKYQNSKNIKIEEQTKIIKKNKKIKVETKYDEIIFSRYIYYNEHEEVLLILESYYIFEKYYNLKTTILLLK